MREPPHPSEVTLQPVGDATIERLTQWVETAHPADIVAEALQKVQGGVPVRSLVAAACLAAARSCSLPAMGGHHGGPIHPISGAHGVLRATGILEKQLDGGWASLPAMHLLVLVNKHINAPDGRRWGEEGNVPGGKWLRAGLVELSPPSDLSAEEAGPALLAALQQEDPEEAERCLIAFLGPDGESAYARRGELMNILLRVSNAYNLFDDHYFNFPIYTYMTLDAIGWEFAPVLLRVCVRYLANEIVPPKGPDVEALRLQGDLRPPRSLYGRSSTGWEELTAMVDDNPDLDLATVSHSALPNEEQSVAVLGDAIGHVDRFVQIPPMIVSAVANGLSLAGAGQALAIGSSELVLRSPVGSPNAHVHFSTGAAARRYLLRLGGVDARQKLLSLLTFVTGPEVLGVDLKEGDQALSPNLFVPSADELQEKSATTSPAEALLEIEQLVARRRDRGLAAVKPHMQRSRKAYVSCSQRPFVPYNLPARTPAAWFCGTRMSPCSELVCPWPMAGAGLHWHSANARVRRLTLPR